MFRGVTNVTLDAKGRLAIPTRYRPRLQEQAGGQLVVTVDSGHILLLYPLPAWIEVEQKLNALATTNPRARQLQRLLVGHATEVELDGAGRVLLPPALREFAALDNRVTLVSYFAFAQQHLTVAWYPSVAAMFKRLEKNLFGSSANYRWWMTAANIFGISALAAAPPLAAFVGGSESRALLLNAGLGALALHWAFALSATSQGWRSRFSLLLAPVGLLAIGAMMARATWKCLAQGAIDWRGTRYPLEQLRAGQRVKLRSLSGRTLRRADRIVN